MLATHTDAIDDIFGDMSPEQALIELDRVDCEESFSTFFRGAWPTIDSALFAGGAALDAVAEHLEAIKDGQIRNLIINIPPRMAKSSMCSVAFPAWVWAQKRSTATSGAGVSIVSGSYSLGLSLRDATKCRRLIQSPWYQARWGRRFKLMGDQNAKGRFDNDKRGSRFATSVGSTLTGEGGNVILIDDPNAAQEAFSEATIESTIDWWDGALSTRLNNPNKGAFIVIQQRLAENDLTGHILSKDRGEWTHLMLPMRYEPERAAMIYPNAIGWSDWRVDEGELLAPDRFNDTAVKALETALGPYGSAGQLQQRPEVKGGGIIKREWWELWDAEKLPAFDYILMSVDTAYTDKKQNDPSAVTVWGVFSESNVAEANTLMMAGGALRVDAARAYRRPHPKALLLYGWTDHLEFNDLLLKLDEIAKRFKIDHCLVEGKASGQSIAQELRRSKSYADYSVQLVDPGTQDKIARLYSVQNLFSDGLIYAPDRPYADKVMTQVANFPKAKHDDLVDTVSQALRFLRTQGMLTMTHEQNSEYEIDTRHTGAPPQPLYGAV